MNLIQAEVLLPECNECIPTLKYFLKYQNILYEKNLQYQDQIVCTFYSVNKYNTINVESTFGIPLLLNDFYIIV